MGLESHSQGMECGPVKPTKTPANASDIVSRFAKVCKFRSIGVFSSQNQSNDSGQEAHFLIEECGSDLTEETESDAENIYPDQPTEERNKKCECGHLDISKLFDTLSAVKLAYIKLQEAHIPYDPDKIIVADKYMVFQLEILCKIKRSLKEKRSKEVDSVSSCSALLLAEIQIQERLLEKLKTLVKTKESDVVNLRRELEDLKLKNGRLARDFREQQRQNAKIQLMYSFEEIVREVRKAIHDFAKPLIALMKVSGWDLDQAASAIEDKVFYAKRSHKKYAFEAYIARRMFNGFSFQSYDTEGSMKFDDPIDALTEDPQSDFARFCRKKYLLLVHPSMENSFFGNVDHRTFVINGLHPHTPFYRAFAKMARWVWFLQGTSASTNSKIESFLVERGADFSDMYMECVEELKEDASLSTKGDTRFKVEFMILPGFKVGNSLIRSQVYLSKEAFSGR